MAKFETSETINGTRSEVWKTLTDFTSYKSWNPFFLSMGSLTRDNLAEGYRFLEKINMPGNLSGYFPMRVRKLDLEKRLSFEMSISVLGFLLYDRHVFTLHEQDGRTTFTHQYEYSGWVFRLVLALPAMYKATIRIHQAMNQSLKEQVEANLG